jgi:hypothetical protein
MFAATRIKSAEYNDVTVLAEGRLITLEQPLISVIDDASPNNKTNYMPVRGVLEALGYTVIWNGSENQIVISRPESPSSKPEETTADEEPIIDEEPEGKLIINVLKDLGIDVLRVDVDIEELVLNGKQARIFMYPLQNDHIGFVFSGGNAGNFICYMDGEKICLYEDAFAWALEEAKVLPRTRSDGEETNINGVTVKRHVFADGMALKQPITGGKPFTEVFGNFNIEMKKGTVYIAMQYNKNILHMYLDPFASYGGGGIVQFESQIGTDEGAGFQGCYLEDGGIYVNEVNFIKVLKETGFIN